MACKINCSVQGIEWEWGQDISDWEKEEKDSTLLNCKVNLFCKFHYQTSSYDSNTGSEAMILDQLDLPSLLSFPEGFQYVMLQETEDNIFLCFTMEKLVPWEFISKLKTMTDWCQLSITNLWYWHKIPRVSFSKYFLCGFFVSFLLLLFWNV